MSTDIMAERRQRLRDERDIPEGHQLIAVWAGPHWQPETGRRCSYAHKGHVRCGKPSAAKLLRGFRRSQWWAYCPAHLYGVWVEDDSVMNWILRKIPAVTQA